MKSGVMKGRSPSQAACGTSPQAATPHPYIVQDSYLVNTLGLSLAFLKRHASRMGAFGRPRNYIYQNVIDYLEGLAEQAKAKAGAGREKQATHAAAIEDLFQEICSLHDSGSNVISLKAMKKKKGGKR